MLTVFLTQRRLVLLNY